VQKRLNELQMAATFALDESTIMKYTSISCSLDVFVSLKQKLHLDGATCAVRVMPTIHARVLALL
jgi:hypothetical protein